MQTFEEHYFIEKITSDIRRAFTTNILKKKKVGVDLGKGKYKNIVITDPSTFRKTKEDIRSEVVSFFKSKEGKTKQKKKFGKIFVKNVYEGEIDSGIEEVDGNPEAVIVYELNNGARIAFITTQDIDGNFRRYIATNSKANDFFRQRLGTTLQQISADAKANKRNIITTKRPQTDVSSEFQSLYKSIASIEREDIEDEESQEMPGPVFQEESKLGIIDISKDDYNSLVRILGTGKRGGIRNSINYPFRGYFERSIYKIPTTGYKGYKYSSGNNEMYLIDTGDGENAFIAFDDESSYDWAKKIGALSYWQSKPGSTKSIDWRKGNIKDLPESNNEF
ncbi:MAG: hypothetical protein ACOC5T_04300 [Elusimicrobiota bacterium]